MIPKIHKTPIWLGSPSPPRIPTYFNRLISIYVDEKVKPNISFPTVLRDSKELMHTAPGSLHVTADVKSLYPNINTQKAIAALDLLLREKSVPETPLLIQLTRIVFENNFPISEFSQDIFLSDIRYRNGHTIFCMLKIQCSFKIRI